MSKQSNFNDLLQKSQELNLKYKTKIIELESELNHQRSKARQYQSKFKDALLQSQYSQGQGLLQKLKNKEQELFDCRKQIIELNRRLTNSTNSASHNDMMALAHENEQLMINIEEIKSAAINAIMLKEEQIQQLNKKIAKNDHLQTLIKVQFQKYQSLQRQFDICMQQKAQEIKDLTDKLARERQLFLNRLEAIQKESYHQLNQKVMLQEKAQDLQGTIVKSQILIADYEDTISELQGQISQQKMMSQQERAKFEIQIEQLKEQIQHFERQEKTLHKALEDLKSKEKSAMQTISKLSEKVQQLTERLSVNKKKENELLKEKITSSFAVISRTNAAYGSFAFRPQDKTGQIHETHKNLGDYPQVQEVDDVAQTARQENQERLNTQQKPIDLAFYQMLTKKKELSPAETKTEPMKFQIQKSQQKQVAQSNLVNDPNPQIIKELESYKQQLEHLKHSLSKVSTEKKQLQNSLNESYNQMQQLNQTINNMSGELQQQRKNIAQLRQQLKKTKKQANLLVQVQSLTHHIEKLQLDMVTSKLKYAEELDFIQQKHKREKIQWTQKLVMLTQQIAKQDIKLLPKPEEKKKKKGFFG